MKLHEQTELYVPFGGDLVTALTETTHMAIAAHQDDIEIMAPHGILACFDSKESRMAAVVCADGGGSSRASIYGNYSDDEIIQVRIREQKKAAAIGDYSYLALLNYTSSRIKDSKDSSLLADLKTLLLETRPQVIYTHNPADKHDTHVAVSLRVIAALQELAPLYRPERFYGCEVWRGLDWVNDNEKVVLNVSGHPALRASLVGVFDSQIEGGKRYDIATMGRQAANATFYASPNSDIMDAAVYALDLMPLVDGGDVFDFVNAYIQRFCSDVKEKILRLT